jgi:hypothetical protein
MKIFVFFIIVIALGIGFGTRLPRDLLINVIIFRDFFDAALPVLAFGALIKYLCTCSKKCSVCNAACNTKKCEEKPAV